jgi:hypothetical protein
MLWKKKYSVYKNIEKIRTVLTNLEIYAEIHPQIISARLLRSGPGSNKIYQIIEQPYRWLPVKITYQAKVSVTGDTITYQISGLPTLQPVMVYQLTSIDSGKTQVLFGLSISGNPLAQRILAHKMLNAQDRFMRNLDHQIR